MNDFTIFLIIYLTLSYLQVTDRIAVLMNKKDVLFRNMYKNKFYGGSFYDGIKVGKPEEYDLDLVLNLPASIQPDLKASDKAGFVNIHIGSPDLILRKKKDKVKFE